MVLSSMILSRPIFEKVLADPTMHLVTWEKGYQKQSWPPAQPISGSMVIERVRNRAQDIRSYQSADR